jgi:hypothetical protein
MFLNMVAGRRRWACHKSEGLGFFGMMTKHKRELDTQTERRNDPQKEKQRRKEKPRQKPGIHVSRT